MSAGHSIASAFRIATANETAERRPTEQPQFYFVLCSSLNRSF